MSGVAAGERSNNFDFLRLYFALLVIFSHSFPLGTGTGVPEPFEVFTRGQTTLGTVAVNCFFAMSGYLITASYFRAGSAWDFLSRRIRRIYPGFIVAMLLGALVFTPLSGGVVWGYSLKQQIGHFLRQAAQLREFYCVGCFARNPYPNMVNGAVWSIFYEFVCYLGLLLLGLSRVLSWRRVTLMLFVVSVAVGAHFAVTHHDWRDVIIGGFNVGLPSHWARLVPMYLSGVIVRLYRDQLRFTPLGAMVSVLLLLLGAVVSPGWIVLFPIAGTYLLFWLAFTPVLRLRNFGRHGDFSYGTYLYGFPVQQLLAKYWGVMNPYAMFLVAAPLALLFALASWRFVERPFLNRAMDPRLQSRPAPGCAPV